MSTHTFISRIPAVTIVAIALTVMSCVGIAFADEIPSHPEKLEFPELNYEPPMPDQYRHQLDCGASAYLAENHEIPTIDLTIIVRTGSMYDPMEKAGLGGMAGYLMRNGGIEGMSIEELDEELEFLASDITVNVTPSRGAASLFCLSKDIDRALELFRGVIKTPVFAQEELGKRQADVLSEMKQRNNSTAAIENREWKFLLYGDHPSTVPYRYTESTINSITRDDLVAWHQQYFFPKNFIIAAAGDFDTQEMLTKLNTLFAGWESHELELPQIPETVPDPEPAVYMIKKEDVNQSRVRLGHMGVKRENPDRYAISIMNDILGGGGFTSRITRRVRSDEGLSYGQGSTFVRPVEYDGTFYAYFQTKHATAAYGTKIILEELERIRNEKVDEEIVENSKASFVSNLVNPFSSKTNIVTTFAGDEYTDRPDDYWQLYTENINAVTPDDVLEVAKKYIHPEKLVYLIVGDPETVQQGWDKDPARFSDFGEVKILPLRDPMTLE